MKQCTSQPAKLFLCYAREDGQTVDKLYAQLRTAGLLPWMDTVNIAAGENWERAIWKAIREADFFVFCLSTRAVNKRGQLQKELKQALEIWKEKLDDDIYIIPVRLEECEVPFAIRQLQYVDLFRDKGFDRLLAAVERGLSRLRVETVVSETPTVIRKQVKEEDTENRYSFSGEYPQVVPDSAPKIRWANARISEFVANTGRTFAEQAIASAGWKNEHKEFSATAWDDLSISSRLELFSNDLLSVRFELGSYYAGAAHPNSVTHTLNLWLAQTKELTLIDIFKPKKPYLEAISKICVSELHRSRYSADAPTSVGRPLDKLDDWIVSGAGPEHNNFKKFLLVKGGIRIVFDPYEVGSYAEGRHEVLVPLASVSDLLVDAIAKLLE